MAGLKRYGKRVFLATSQLLNALLSVSSRSCSPSSTPCPVT